MGSTPWTWLIAAGASLAALTLVADALVPHGFEHGRYVPAETRPDGTVTKRLLHGPMKRDPAASALDGAPGHRAGDGRAVSGAGGRDRGAVRRRMRARRAAGPRRHRRRYRHRPGAAIGSWSAMGRAAIRTITPGLAHGTVTALRRRPHVRDHHPAPRCRDRRPARAGGFHRRLAADAARRDFTINALYADRSGRVFDPDRARASPICGRPHHLRGRGAHPDPRGCAADPALLPVPGLVRPQRSGPAGPGRLWESSGRCWIASRPSASRRR